MCVADITIPQILWRRQVCLLVVPLIQKEQHSFSFRRYFQLQELHILFVWVALEKLTQLTPIVISFCVNLAIPLPFWFVPPWPYTYHLEFHIHLSYCCAGAIWWILLPSFRPTSLTFSPTRALRWLHCTQRRQGEWLWQDVELMAVWRDKNV